MVGGGTQAASEGDHNPAPVQHPGPGDSGGQAWRPRRVFRSTRWGRAQVGSGRAEPEKEGFVRQMVSGRAFQVAPGQGEAGPGPWRKPSVMWRGDPPSLAGWEPWASTWKAQRTDQCSVHEVPFPWR